MFPKAFFANAYFVGSYWPPVDGGAPVSPTGPVRDFPLMLPIFAKMGVR